LNLNAAGCGKAGTPPLSPLLVQLFFGLQASLQNWRTSARCLQGIVPPMRAPPVHSIESSSFIVPRLKKSFLCGGQLKHNRLAVR